MPESNSVLKALLLCLCGFVYKLTATFAVLLSFSSFLKISGRAGLPYFYIGLSVGSLLIGGLLFSSRYWRMVTVRISYLLNPLMAVLLAWVGMNYGSLQENSVFVLYIAVSLYDIYFGIFFWNFANAVMTVREMRSWVGIISAVTFSGGIILGYLFPLLFSMISFASCFLVCAAMYLILPVFVAILPAEHDEARSARTEQQAAPLSVFVKEVLQHPMSMIIVWIMLVLAFARYSTSFLFSASLSRKFTSETDLASFAGAFESSLRLLSSFTQAFLLPFLLKRFRPTELLRLTPVLLIAGAMALLINPGFWVIVVFQFVLMTAIRTFDLNLLNLFFNLYEKALRNRFRFFSDGIVFAGAVIFTGLIIARFSQASEGAMLYWLLLISGLGYWYFAGKAQKGYVLALQENLHVRSGSGVEIMPDEGSEFFDREAELQKIMALPPRHWALALGRLSRHNCEGSAQIIKTMLSQPRQNDELSILIKIAGRNGSVSLRSVVQQFLDQKEDPRVAADAVEAIYRLNGNGSLPLLLQLMTSANNRVRANAVLAVIRLTGDELQLREALMNLQEMARSELADFRASAAAMLGELPVSCFSKLLEQVLFDADPRVRQAAIKSCVKWRDPDWIKILREVMHRFPEDGAVLYRAMQSLEQGLLRRIEIIAVQNGNLQRVNEVLSLNRETGFVEVFCQLLIIKPGVAACNLMELLANQGDEELLQVVGSCLEKGRINLDVLGEWLKKMPEQNFVQKIQLELLRCLSMNELTVIAGQVMAADFHVGTRKLVFCACCGLHGFSDDDGGLFARLGSPDSSERDMALELIETTCSQSDAKVLKNLAGFQ